MHLFKLVAPLIFVFLLAPVIPPLPTADCISPSYAHAQSFPGDQELTPQSAEPAPSGLQGIFKGSLLGKLLFNQPFERASMIDILAILILAFIVSKIISRPGSNRNGARDNENWPADENRSEGPAAPPPGFDPWARLRSNQNQQPKKGKTIPFPGVKQNGQDENEPQYAPPAQEALKDDSDFLKGAKLLYVRLHEAQKNQDIEFIEHFTSPQACRKLTQADSREYLDIVRVEAAIIREGSRNGDPFITVEFNALAHKPGHPGPPVPITERWSFLEPAATGTWRLEEF
ncbi:MAG: hypothetical protein IJD04_09035 [Desulfovibrionaceae bacterium]|nr:hypothetical protein [Desulfovibrionaceae bacterium]